MNYSEAELKVVIKIAAEIGAKSALLAIQEREKAIQKVRKDRKLHNTRMLLEKYRIFNEHIDNATYKKAQIDTASAVEWLNNVYLPMYDPNNKADQIVESIRNSALKTKILVEHINKMVKVYEIYCSLDESPKLLRRYEAFYGRYISQERLSYETVAEKWNVDVRTIQRDVNDAISDFSSLLFGIDFISKSERIM